MSHSQDNSQRGIYITLQDFINSIDSANKITAKQFIKTQNSFEASRLKITRPDEENQSMNESVVPFNQLKILSATNNNILKEKALNQIFFESLLYGISNFCIIYYIALLVLGIYYKVMSYYNQIYLIFSIVVSILICFYDAFLNKLNLLQSIDKDQQLCYTYINDGFTQCHIGELRPGNIIKLAQKQQCPADGYIIGNSGGAETIQLIEFSGQVIQRKAAIVNLTFGKSLEGSLDYISDDKKPRLSLKIETNHCYLELASYHKIQFLQANNHVDELYVLITGFTQSDLKQQQSVYDKTTVDPKLGFSLHMQTLLSIMLHIFLGIILLICHAIQSVDLYLDDGIKEDLMPKYVEFLCMLSWGIPILQMPFLSFINRIAKSKAQNDRLLDPELSENKAKIRNSNALANMARAKYILTDLQLLTRKIKKVTNLFLNKSSDEINLNNLVTVIPIEDIEDPKFCQSEIKYALLSFKSSGKTQEDIAICSKILEYDLFVGNNRNEYVIQDQEQNQLNFTRMFELIQTDYSLFGYEHIERENIRQYMILYRSTFKDCKEFLESGLQLQLRDSIDIVDNLNNLVVIFKKIVPKSYIERIEKLVKTKKNLDNETVKQIRQELEPCLFFEFDLDFYDCSQEILDIRNCEYKLWINCHIKDPQLFENDPTLAGLIRETSVSSIMSQNSDELQVALDQFQMNNVQRQIKFAGKEQSFFSNDKPVMVILDDQTLEIGLKNELLQSKFSDVLLKIPIIIFLSSKPHLNYLLLPLIKHYELICVTKYIKATASMQISIGDDQQITSDIQLPHFSFLPKLIIVHGRLINIRQQLSVSFVNYACLILFFAQFNYVCYNRFSTQYLLNDFIHLIIGSLTPIYGLLHLAMTQDFNFELLRQQPIYHVMVRVTKNPYKILAYQIFQAAFHAAFIVFTTIIIFYGSNDTNGYIHGVYLQQFVILCVLLAVIAFKPMLEQYKIGKIQIYLAIIFLATTILIIQKQNGIMKYIFESGIKTKDLCSIFFLPICALSPNLIFKLGQRLLSSNFINNSLQKMEIEVSYCYQSQYEENVENQRLRDAKNYIKLVKKEEMEIEEDIVNSKKVL